MKKKYKDLLPWYINKTLSEKETFEIESWLQSDPEAEVYFDSVQQMNQAISTQSITTPSHQVRANILNAIQQPVQKPKSFIQWIWGVPLATLIFSLLWLIIQPGNQLQWIVREANAAAFRVYRAPVGETTFTLIEELPANPSQQVYQYTDPVVVPGQNFYYTVEIIDQSGNTSISQVAGNNMMMVFASQVAILLASFTLAFGMITIAQEINLPRQLNIAQQ